MFFFLQKVPADQISSFFFSQADAAALMLLWQQWGVEVWGLKKTLHALSELLRFTKLQVSHNHSSRAPCSEVTLAGANSAANANPPRQPDPLRALWPRRGRK